MYYLRQKYCLTERLDCFIMWSMDIYTLKSIIMKKGENKNEKQYPVHKACCIAGLHADGCYLSACCRFCSKRLGRRDRHCWSHSRFWGSTHPSGRAREYPCCCWRRDYVLLRQFQWYDYERFRSWLCHHCGRWDLHPQWRRSADYGCCYPQSPRALHLCNYQQWCSGKWVLCKLQLSRRHPV